MQSYLFRPFLPQYFWKCVCVEIGDMHTNIPGITISFTSIPDDLWFCVVQDGIVKLKWDETSPLVYTASLDGVVRMWDARSGKEETRWTGHSAAILDFDITACVLLLH